MPPSLLRTFPALLFSLLLALAGARPASAAAVDAPDIYAANARLGRGVNLANALEAPKEGEWGVTLQAEYFAAIKAAGFATVRLPIKFSAHAESAPPYAIDPKFLARVDWAVEQALANKLNIIVDLHHYGEMDSQPEEHAARLAGLWEQIAAHYQHQPSSVYFELLNEPHDKLTSAVWNRIIPKALAAIRKTNPHRPVIVGPTMWNSIGALKDFELPTADRSLILTVHFYDPFQFTHQGAPWASGSAAWKGKKWTGSEPERKAIHDSFQKAAQWAKEHDRPVFLGEFGAYQEADMESRARWTRFVTEEVERLGFSWAYWEFCAGFGLYDKTTKTWREPLKAALIQ